MSTVEQDTADVEPEPLYPEDFFEPDHDPFDDFDFESYADDQFIAVSENVALSLIAAENRVAKREAEADMMRAGHLAALARCDGWLDRMTRKDRDKLELRRSQLRGLVEEHLDHNPKAPKTIVLPSAEITTHVGGVSVEITNDVAALRWVRDNAPHLVRWTQPRASVEAIDRVALKKDLGNQLVERDGEVYSVDGDQVPGLVVVHSPRTIDIELLKDQAK